MMAGILAGMILGLIIQLVYQMALDGTAHRDYEHWRRKYIETEQRCVALKRKCQRCRESMEGGC